MLDIKNIITNIKNQRAKYLMRGYYSLSIIIFLWLAFFMYQNFYVTIGDIKVLSILKNQVTQEMVNIQTWDEVKKELEWKKQILADTELLNNPFK